MKTSTSGARWSVAVLFTLTGACGGVTNSNNAGPTSESRGGSSTTGGSLASGGRVTTGGGTATAAAGAPTTPETALSVRNPFDSPNAVTDFGLWMELGDELPIGEPPLPHDGSALHLVGDSGAGLDFFFHTALPVERFFGRVDFWAYSEQPGSTVTIAVAGPEPKYFEDRDQGSPWPVEVVKLSAAWQPFDVAFSSLGIDKTHPGPREQAFGAVHFIVEPNTHYDFWIDDFELAPAG